MFLVPLVINKINADREANRRLIEIAQVVSEIGKGLSFLERAKGQNPAGLDASLRTLDQTIKEAGVRKNERVG